MTSFRQIEANRRNAIRSTGPRTEEGKRQTRRNAVRHGLCAETVVDSSRMSRTTRAFEAAVIADYDAQTAVERELVLRLASLLWRLRRATAIETDLLSDPGRNIARAAGPNAQPRPQPIPFRVVETALCDLSADGWNASEQVDHQARAPFPPAETSRREIWRIAFNGSPISTPASSSGSGAMKPRCGAKWYRSTFCSNQPDVANAPSRSKVQPFTMPCRRDAFKIRRQQPTISNHQAFRPSD